MLEKKIDQTLEFISSFNTRENSSSFLESITKYLSGLFDFKFVVIDKYSVKTPSIIETVVVCGAGGIMPNIKYHLKNTPCDKVIDSELCVYPNNVRKQFPKDQLLVEMGVESYIGIPLWGSNGDPIGLIAMMDDKELEDSKTIGVILKIVAIKVSQELENQLFENELKLKIQDLSASEDKYRSIVENSPNWIWEVDNTGVFTYSNYQFEELLGAKLSSQNVFDLIPDAEKNILLKYFQICVVKKEGWKDLEIRWVDKEGRSYYFQSTAVPILDQKGFLNGFRGINRDVTKEKITKQNLKIAYEKLENSDRLKTEFLHNMSHEIRTPMNGILGFSNMLDDYKLTDQERKSYINIIQSSGEQLLQIIDDILEISKLETNQVQLVEQETSLNILFTELFLIFNIKAKEQGLSLHVHKGLSDEASKVYTDKTKLIKVLGNLLENALKFTAKGSVNFGYVLKTVNDKPALEIFVRDTGIGIKLEMQEIIFDRFSQAEKRISRKAGGLGLGLSIAKENTEILGGKMKVNSKFMQGTTFFVTLPYKPVDSEVNVLGLESEEKIESMKNTILVAEDEEVNFMFLEILLLNKLKLDCNVLHAINGQEAVDICRNNPEVNLVLMDIKMPKLNGFEATKQIKEFCPDLTIIAQTAYSSREDNELALQAGYDDFISKPIKADALKKIIGKYLKKGSIHN